MKALAIDGQHTATALGLFEGEEQYERLFL
jgi:hypothetical protein